MNIFNANQRTKICVECALHNRKVGEAEMKREYIVTIDYIGETPPGNEELVRCKDCINKECFGRNGKIVCDLDGFLHGPDWFCADGERRTEDA